MHAIGHVSRKRFNLLKCNSIQVSIKTITAQKFQQTGEVKRGLNLWNFATVIGKIEVAKKLGDFGVFLDLFKCRTHSRRLVWRCHSGRRRRRRRACTSRSWMFFVVQSRSRTPPGPTYDAPGTSSSRAPAATCSTAPRRLQSVALALLPTLLRTWWPVRVLVCSLLRWRRRQQRLEVCEVVTPR